MFTNSDITGLPDQKQRDEALDITRSFIVQAPAGSGKTELLTRRFIKLLEKVNNPEEIIAITFTKKAAAEMRRRILLQVPEIEISRLRVLTIDAFCGYLVSQMPVKTRLIENFRIIEQPHEIYKTAIENLFLSPSLPEHILSDFLLYLDNDITRVKNLLIDILESRDQWLPHIFTLNAMDALEHAWQKLDYQYTEVQKKFIQALSSLLLILTAEVQLIFEQRGEVDFIEVLLRALDALGQDNAPTDLALKLDYQIKHLLIDEFQDTSLSQWRLFQKLTQEWEPHDGRTLFLVGDPMQSIYRFRKAEVGLFLQVQQTGIHHIFLKPLILTANFRSGPLLIDWYNKTFSVIFPDQSDLHTGAIIYSPAQSPKYNNQPEINSLSLLSPELPQESVFYHPVDHSIDPFAQAHEIKKIIGENPDQKIAVLVRSRSHLKSLMTVLQKNKILYRAVEIGAMADHPLIEDLWALTQALLHLADRIAWLAILRAPWCGLTLQDMAVLFESDYENTVYDCLHNVQTLAKLDKDTQIRIKHLLTAMNWGINMRDRLPLGEWVQTTWRKLKGPACLDNAELLKIAQCYFDLLMQSENTADMPVKLARTALPANSDLTVNLELMTIHKAKGLEFDIVILPSLEKYTRAEASKLFLWEERINLQGEIDLLVAPITPVSRTRKQKMLSQYDFLKQQEQTRAHFELQRLLYVAATRAKKSLHLLFSVNLKNPAKNSFLNLLWPLIAENIHLKPKFVKPENKIISTTLKRLKIENLAFYDE